ncbi:ATPase AAA [Devosia sp. 17-2-E-8]|uniref:replication-associated recombination protein A n=1 Tax=Paradevosia shaoguanensis TaxID=1335043 RepID=UPI000455CA26|nr:replication-associated recombination protein A [Paradevosia shaoguanensis]KFL28595.1 ATPase AAA [Devosia sp. 17-2-E-8]QMV01653.1 AAA family ATPase [Devosia sp. D6-9]CDP53982.1 FIG065221: Holliday junction DNA helicase [Devosia sp. DBB001]
MGDLFSPEPDGAEPSGEDLTNRPLADQLRPRSLDEVIGQQHLLGPEGTLRRMIASGRLGSLILWGPPGTGKTTVARLLADQIGYKFEQISAVFSGVADLKKAFEKARGERMAGKRTLLFVDEIHRFNRAQQDGFLPVMEDGTVVLVGATTENPSFELNAALLSRSQVLRFESLSLEDLEALAKRAEAKTGEQLPLDDDARAMLLTLADGDGRALLGLVEEVMASARPGEVLDKASLLTVVQRRAPIYDKAQDGHYNLISALHKTIRGSDPNAALYYFARMLEAGEDPLFLARRLIRMSVEDIGLADPQALQQAIAARDAYQMLGSPEGELALAQVVVYLALAPKSNAVYTAFKSAMKVARDTGSPMPPMVILNAPTKLMGKQGYGAGYIYDHDTPEAFSGQEYFPEKIGRQDFYRPVERGFERDLAKRLEYFTRLREKKRGEER